MNKNWKIYALKDPLDISIIKYVGYTGDLLENRLAGHIREAKSKKYNTHKINWILSLLSAGRLPIIELLEDNIHLEHIDDKEIYYISKFSSSALTNSTIGGDGIKEPSLEIRMKISKSLTGKTHSIETKNKMSTSHKGKHSKKRKTHVKSIETKNKISKANSGKKRSDSVKKLMSERNLGKKLSEETKQKISNFQKQQDKPWLFGNSYATGSVRSDEYIKNLKEIHSDTKLIHNNFGIHKKVKKVDIQIWLSEGWKLGRLKVISDIKTCIKCKMEKKLLDYYVKSSYCKSCHNERTMENRKRNR